ncbi:hypothetical protein ABC337_04850 [Arthrobacter sp. 1P04PC]|uniref:hypothetical protein n=1 Tax=unclassified Arthrobacter TaxID=235627 RepID=UPI0039A06346
MKITAEPRSDQWNADDFTGGPRIFTVAGVKNGAAEQKYDVELVEGEGRVWRPPLGMLRVLMEAWGDQASVWVGRRVTLYKDPTVRFGKEVPGGIRISHLSHIGGKPLNVPITVARGTRRTYTVQPLPDEAAAQSQQPSEPWREQWQAITSALTAAGHEGDGKQMLAIAGQVIGATWTHPNKITAEEAQNILATIQANDPQEPNA